MSKQKFVVFIDETILLVFNLFIYNSLNIAEIFYLMFPNLFFHFSKFSVYYKFCMANNHKIYFNFLKNKFVNEHLTKSHKILRFIDRCIVSLYVQFSFVVGHCPNIMRVVMKEFVPLLKFKI